MPSRRTIVIAGGGTGGHIYPALAIARAVKAKDPQIEVHFVGTASGLETKIVPRENFPLHLIHVGRLNHSGGFFSKIRTLLGLPRALLQSAALLFELKPEAVLGVGGFVSGPFVLTASLFGFRASVWEPNAKPGMTNRWLSRFVRRSYVVFGDAAKELRSREVIPVGLPVRREIEDAAPGEGPSGREFRILVFGGSQGARGINRVVREAVRSGTEWRQGIVIRHQTGTPDYADTMKDYEGLTGVEAREYLHDMDAQYAWADLVICRSGASTVAELAAARKASILVPLPSAADDHQTKNAESLASQNAAILLPQSQLTAARLIEEILALKNDSQRREAMRENLQHFHKPRAAERIADLILSSGDL